MIPARVSIVTLGAYDLEALRAFYSGLGWRDLMKGMAGFAAFDTGGAALALFPAGDLAHDAGLAREQPRAEFRGVALALNVETREQVDAVIDELRSKGARITKEPVDAEWGGRSAYWADPEGNLWEVAWNPNVTFDARGTMVWRGSRL